MIYCAQKPGVGSLGALIFVLELIGTAAFAVSGAVLGVKKGMDIFGVFILGLTTAVGGGVIRDVILGETPPRTFQSPVYALLALAVSLITFLICRRGMSSGKHRAFDLGLFIMDSLGLGAFTVTAMGTAMESGQDGAFLLVFVGVVTGVGGGVLRDLFAGETPYIFVKHVYASASLLGAVVYLLCLRLELGTAWASIAGMAATLLLRALSAHFRWNLPHAQGAKAPGGERPGD